VRGVVVLAGQQLAGASHRETAPTMTYHQQM
jgi:hypothetical protein